MDDLLLFTPSKEAHMSPIRRPTESFIKEWVENITKQVPII